MKRYAGNRRGAERHRKSEGAERHREPLTAALCVCEYGACEYGAGLAINSSHVASSSVMTSQLWHLYSCRMALQPASSRPFFRLRAVAVYLMPPVFLRTK